MSQKSFIKHDAENEKLRKENEKVEIENENKQFKKITYIKKNQKR